MKASKHVPMNANQNIYTINKVCIVKKEVMRNVATTKCVFGFTVGIYNDFLKATLCRLLQNYGGSL